MATSLLGQRPIDSLRHDPTSPRRHIDVVSIVVTIGLTVFGMLAIYSAKHRDLVERGVDPYFYVKRQLVATALGLVLAVVIAAVDYRKWRDWAVPLFGLTTVLLAGVKVFGQNINGAQAWYQVGTFQLQPSELAKVTLILGLAAYVAAVKGLDTWRRLSRLLLIAAVPCVLTLAQPDLGTTMVLGSITLAILLVAGARGRHLAVLSMLAVAAVAIILGTGQLKAYQEARLTTFLNPGAAATPEAKGVANNLEQSQIAIGNGGLYGKGYLKGVQTNLSKVPESQTDFVFSVIGEEFGFVGGAIMLGLFSILVLRIWRTAMIARDDVGTYICVGAFAMVVIQVFENVGMTMGIMPITGIPLPLISYGGSSTLAVFAMLGLVQSVHMHRY
ncbi:MAG: rod shape-determining protein RodA [Acidimicrobiia bacterium]